MLVVGRLTRMAVRTPEKPTAELPAPPPSVQPTPPARHRGAWIVAGVIIAALLVSLVPQAERGIDVERLVNPNGSPSDLEWAGLSVGDFWVPVFYVVTFGLMALMLGIFYRH